MTDEPLRPASTDELTQALAFALNHDGRKSYKLANEAMARIVAEHLVRYLEQSRFVVMKRPPSLASSTHGDAP